MKGSQYIYVSKLDAAKRQLDHAIKLFLSYGDPVVIHALATAALRVLRDLGRKQKVSSIILGEIMDKIKPEKKEEVKKLFTSAENYFKHADKDEQKLLKFYFKVTEFYIFDACVTYIRLTNEAVPLYAIYQGWFYANHPEILVDQLLKYQFLTLLENFDPKDRKSFYDLLPVIEAKIIKK